jgi:hypothetical protein
VWRLRITLDQKYPGIIDRCRDAIDVLMPRQHASIEPQPKGCVVVSPYSKYWPCLLIRGLIHSDGCRVVANERGVKSVRYHFSNRSEDILGLFTSALDDLGIPWTRSSNKIVSIYRKAATARLDEFVGPKS